MTDEERKLLLAVADGVASMLVPEVTPDVKGNQARATWSAIGRVMGDTEYTQQMLKARSV